jgi:hypothetical protein
VNKSSVADEHDAKVRAIADDFERRGYRVSIHPVPSRLPEFLRSHRPDILAEGADESVVVEVGLSERAPEADRWRELAELLRGQPGWRLELVVQGDPEGPPSTPLDRSEIEERLRDGRDLLEQDRIDAALLLSWSATEAALRLLSDVQRLESPDLRPATIISRLYSDGLLDRADYDVLMRCMRSRNAAVHGFREPRARRGDIESLQAVAGRVLRASRRRRAAV